jgi:dCTP deaminase
MIAGHNLIKKYIAEKKLVLKPISEDSIRESGIDLRLDHDLKLEPHAFNLAWTKEWIELPVELVGFCNLRSTLARMGMVIPPTIVDPGFRGQLVIGIVNMNDSAVELREGERFLHLILAQCEGALPYSGKYQNQKQVYRVKKD